MQIEMIRFIKKAIRIFVMTGSFLSVTGVSVFAAGNLIDFTDSNIISAMGLRSESSVTYNGASQSGAPKNTSETSVLDFRTKNILTDWSTTDTITCTVYNEKADNSSIDLTFIFDNAVYEMNNSGSQSAADSDAVRQYQFMIDWNDKTRLVPYSESSHMMTYRLKADWSGWKTVNIPITSFTAAGGMKRLDAMEGLSLKFSKNTGIYIDSILGSTQALKNTSLYAGKNRIKSGDLFKDVSYYPEYKDDTLFLPVQGFNDVLGAVVSRNGNKAVINYNGIQLSLDADSSTITIGGITQKIKETPYIKNNDLYVPVCEILDVLGVGYYAHKRFISVGNGKFLEELRSGDINNINPVRDRIEKAICNDQPALSEAQKKAACDTVLARWEEYLLGSAALNDTNNSRIMAQINDVTRRCRQYTKTFVNNSSTHIFSDITAKESADMTGEYDRIYYMALAYGMPGGEYYKNKTLLANLKYALSWMYQNRYGEDEINNNANAWRNPNTFNWWDWKIGSPQRLVDIIMVLRNDLTTTEKNNYLRPVNAFCDQPITEGGSNGVDNAKIVLKSAILSGNYDKAAEMKDFAETQLVYVDSPVNQSSVSNTDKAQGFYTDGSYVYHMLHAMNGTYGLAHFQAVSEMAELLSGTGLEISKPKTDIMADWFRDSFDALIANGRMPRMVLGRHDTDANEAEFVRSSAASVLTVLDAFDDVDRQEIMSILKEYLVNNAPNTNYYSGLGIKEMIRLEAIENDASILPKAQKESRVFGNMDKVMHKSDTWALALSMSSSRMYNYESINNCNKNGWYLSDGMTELIARNTSSKSTSDYWTHVNYYRLPGTTVDTQPRESVSIELGHEFLSSEPFVGGATMEGQYQAAAMQLESYHNNGEITGAPLHTSDLKAKKSYFMFDNSVFCLGADINASNNNNAEVLTVVENYMANTQRYDNGTFLGTDNICIDGVNSYVYDTDVNISKKKWVNIADECGYYFPNDEAQNIYIRRTRGTSKSFNELWISHGKNPKLGKYAYALLPDKTAAQTAEYSSHPDVRILKNDASVQAVHNTRLNIKSYVFWNSTKFDGISVSAPIILMKKLQENMTSFAICDPSQKLENVTITVDGLLIPENDVAWSYTNGKTTISINLKNLDGQTVGFNTVSSGAAFNRVQYGDSDGNPVDNYLLDKQSSITFMSTIYNADTAAKNITCYLAQYDSSGKLINVKSYKNNISEQSLQNISHSSDIDKNCAKAALYVWEDMKPCKEIKIK